jgi:hypothetical protein
MNKRLILLFSIVTIAFSDRMSAQPADSGVEIRLKLIQGVGDWSIKNLALSVSVINHTDSDIYIPGFRFMIYAAGINLYREEQGKFVKIDILGIKQNVHPLMVPDSDNAITSFYGKKIPVERYPQDSLILAFCQKNHLSAAEWKLPGNQPLFLKAGQHLDDFTVLNIDHTWKNAGEYKIAFEAKNVNPAYSPAEILGYRCFPTGLIKGNVLYYSDIDYDKLGKN